MARRLLNQVCPVLQTAGVISHSTGRNILTAKQNILSNHGNNGSSLSYCVFHHWCSLQHNSNIGNNVQPVDNLKGPNLCFNNKRQSILEASPNVRCISNSSGCHSSMTTTKTRTSSVSDGDTHENLKHKKKAPTKSSVKEFTIKDNISDHDMSIKLSKMQNLLDKGKVIEIFIKYGRAVDTEQKKNVSASRMQKRIEEGLVGFKPLRMDFSNKTTIKFTTRKLDVPTA